MLRCLLWQGQKNTDEVYIYTQYILSFQWATLEKRLERIGTEATSPLLPVGHWCARRGVIREVEFANAPGRRNDLCQYDKMYALCKRLAPKERGERRPISCWMKPDHLSCFTVRFTAFFPELIWKHAHTWTAAVSHTPPDSFLSIIKQKISSGSCFYKTYIKSLRRSKRLIRSQSKKDGVRNTSALTDLYNS